MFGARHITNSRDVSATYVETDKLRVDSTRTDAFIVGRDSNGTDVLTVDTENKTIAVVGDLSVTGNLSFTELKSFSTTDSLIKLADTNAADLIDIGLFGEYTSSEQNIQPFIVMLVIPEYGN